MLFWAGVFVLGLAVAVSGVFLDQIVPGMANTRGQLQVAHMIHAAASGNAQALSLIGQMAEQMSKVGGDMARVAALIRPLINGERDPDRLCARLDTRGRQLVLQILEELGRLELH